VMRSMLQDQQVRASLAKVGLEPIATVPSPAEFARHLAQSNGTWGKTVRDANIKVELK
jgi:hypothetical protein